MSRLTIFACMERIRNLSVFMSLLKRYSSGLYGTTDSLLSVEDERMDQDHLRERINRLLPKVSKFMRETKYYPILAVQEPPAVGGRIWPHYDAIENIFNLSQFDIPLQIVIDYVNRAIGYYYDDLIPSFFRTINPFWWLWQLSIFIIRVPFLVLDWAGYDAAKIEQSSQGRMYKRVAGILAFIAALVAFLGSLADIINVLGLAQSLREMLFN
ncbi:MAG: hypothetical protein ACLFVO_08925 [Chloroflexaceae bacterium]